MIVSGRLEVDQFTDRNGKNVRLVVVEAYSIHLVDALNTQVIREGVGASVNAAYEQSAAPMASVGASEEEIPF